jgi:hypothetical protein
MIEMSPEVNHLFPALISAQSKLRGVVKDSKNPHFKSNYASLENVIDTARGPLHEDGIAFTQAPGALVDGAIEITTMLMHRSGQWLRSTLHIPLQKRDPQGVGSAITYGCRYALMATLGLPPVDDDGESAMDRNPAPSQARVTPANPSLTRTDTGTAGVPLSDADQETLVSATKSAGKMCADPDTLRVWWMDQLPRLKPNLSADQFDHLKTWVAVTASSLAEQEAA